MFLITEDVTDPASIGNAVGKDDAGSPTTFFETVVDELKKPHDDRGVVRHGHWTGICLNGKA
jgi:hypothetical protein